MLVEVERHPAPGETVVCGAAASCTAEGANQAVRPRAAARSRSSAAWTASRPARCRATSSREAVGVTHLRTDPDAPSGRALIVVDSAGENTIVISPGANARMGEDDVAGPADLLRVDP